MVSELRLSGKVAVVTGAAHGIGRAIALRFAAEGASLVANDLNEAEVEAVVEKIKESRGQALGVKADVSRREEVDELLAACVRRFGQVDILVNSAGLRRDAPVDILSIQEWEAVLGVQLRAAFLCAQAAQRHMVSHNYGRIVLFGAPFPAALAHENVLNYAAAGAGIIGLTQALAWELGKHNVTVNCIAPDFIDTEMTRAAARRSGMYLDDFTKAAAAQVPLRRLGRAEEVAGVALFLASDDASYVTGQVIRVAGGA